MSDENKNAETPDETVTQPAAETPETDERRFSQAEVDAIAKAERAKGQRRGRAEARKEVKANVETPKEQEPTDNGVSEVASRLQDLETQLAFSEALLGIPNANLNAARKRALRAVFDPENPEQLAKDYTDLFGGDTPPPAGGTPDADDPAGGAPASEPVAPFDPGAAAGAPRDAGDNPLKWSKSDYARMRARGGREALDKVEAYRSTLPGGNPSMFRRKIPKG